MLVGPVVEGFCEERTIPILLSKIGVRFRTPIRAQGKPDLIRRARDYGQLQIGKGATHVLYCFDADGPDGPNEERLLIERVRDESALEKAALVCVPVHELEAWLLADEEALGRVLGATVQPISAPESIPDPVRELSEIFKRAGKAAGYVKTTDAHRIAEEAAEKRLRRCPSFLRAVTAMLASN